MLRAIRENAQGLVIWIIGIIIVIPFALWGIQDYLGGGGKTEALATIDGQDIENDEFDRYYRAYRQTELRKIEQLGDKLPLSIKNKLLDESVMRRAALESLIRSRLLATTALTAGMEYGDRQLAETIQVMPVFQRDGVFDKALYDYAVRNQGMSTTQFENSLRNDLISQQLMNGILFSEFATKSELRDAVRLINQQRKAGYMVIPSTRYEKEASPTDEELQAYYDAHASEYVAEEQARIKYIELSESDVTREVTVSDEAMRTYYKEHSGDYAVPDTTDAEEKISQILKNIREGASFEELAKQYSEDEGSRDNGGDLGYFGKGVMAQSFEDKVFSMEKGEVSEPVKTAFGMHIIKLNDIRGDERQASHILVRVDKDKTRIRSFDEVKDQIRKDLAVRLAEDRFVEQVETLTNLTYEVPNTLEDAANALGLEIRTSESFTRAGGKGIARHERVVTATFNEDVLAGNNSEPIELERNHFLVLRIDEHTPSRHLKLEEVRDIVRQRVAEKQAAEKAATTGGIIVKRLGEGDDVAGISKEHNLEWHEPVMLERTSREINSAVLRSIFSIARPDGEAPVYSGARLANGDYAVIGLYSVVDGDVDKIGEKESQVMLGKILRANGESNMQHFLARSRELARVQVHEQPEK
jgi:peptidyl-prolyl cis-trans isomerase D